MPTSQVVSTNGSDSSGAGGRLSIAIVDDHPPIREALRSRIEEEMGIDVVGEAGSKAKAFSLIEEQGPDVAIVDLSLSDGQGFELIEALQAECAETKVLVFSVRDETVYAERALRIGASGYVMKPAGTAEVLIAARRVAENGVHLSSEMTSRVLQGMRKEQTENLHFPIDKLTDRELQVFRLLGQGLTVESVAKRLEVTRKTAEAHRRRAKEKLGYETVDQVVSHAARWLQTEGHSPPASPTR